MANEHPDNVAPYEVLLVEDNADDADLCMRVLQKAHLDLGIEIKARALTSSTEASKQVQQQKFDVIFLDVAMPPPDGIELTMIIRKSGLNRATPVVIITGAEDRGLMARAFHAGANWFLFKPVERSRLLHLIQAARPPIERERRRLRRIKVQCKVTVESEGDSFEGQTLDLSLSGMGLLAKRVLPVGSQVRLTLYLPNTALPIRVAARVVRIIGSDGMGLEFEKLGGSENERLGEFLVPLVAGTV